MNRWRKIIAPLIFLPNIMPLKALFSAEIFPWAFLYTLRKDLRVPLPFLLFLGYLLVSAAWGLVLGNSWLVMARALFALVNATLIFFVLVRVSRPEYNQLLRVFEWVFFINTALCLVQFLGLFPPALDPLFRLFIDRFTAEIYGGGRGVAGLFAEPSYASMSMHYYFALFMLNRRMDPRSKEGIIAIASLVIFDLFIIRSITGLVMIAIYLASLQTGKNLIKAGGVLALAMALLIGYFGASPKAPRSLEAAHDFVKYEDYKDPMPWLLEQSGFRFVSVWAAYRYGLTHPFGSGVGNWGPASIQAMDDIGVKASAMSFFATALGAEYQGVRPTAFGAGLMLETGLLGFVLFCWAMWPYVRRLELFRWQHSRSVLLFFLFNIFALGSIGDPLPFIVFALSYRTVFSEEGEALPIETAA